MQTATEKPRTRRFRKRTNFKHVPRPVYPIRALWLAASPEEQTRAHRTCVVILEYWLGKKSKKEEAAELSVSPLRVWQLSAASVPRAGVVAWRKPRRT